MASIGEKKALRRAVLAAVYRLSDGDTMPEYPPGEVAITPEVHDVAPLASGPDVEQAIRWNVSQGFMTSSGIAGHVGITHHGVNEAEQILEAIAKRRELDAEEARATELGDEMERMQRENAATIALVIVTPEQRATLEQLTSALQRAVEDGLDLDSDDQAEVQVQIDTIQTQLRSPRPRAGVIGTALKALRWTGGQTIAGILGNAAYAGLAAFM